MAVYNNITISNQEKRGTGTPTFVRPKLRHDIPFLFVSPLSFRTSEQRTTHNPGLYEASQQPVHTRSSRVIKAL